MYVYVYVFMMLSKQLSYLQMQPPRCVLQNICSSFLIKNSLRKGYWRGYQKKLGEGGYFKKGGEVLRDGMVGTSKGTMGNGFNHERIDILTMKRKNPDESH